MPRQRPTDLFYLGIILGSCILAYWPLSFSLFSLKNDAVSYFLPVRYQVSEAISNGEWPFWSPFFNLGYPLHGDMMSGVWNPFVWLFSIAGPYTMKTLQYETLLYVYISGLSMYYLCRYFIADRSICLLAAISYMLCGYNSDSAQFLNWISSAAFIPFVFLFYYRLLTEHTVKSALLTALFLFLLFSTAYPADFILMLYLMAGMAVWHLIRLKLSHKNKSFFKLIKLHSIAVFCFALLSLPAIVSYIEFLPLANRGDGVSLEVALTNSYHPLLLFSYITPLNIWRAPGVSITDPLARNSFIGIITFVLLLTSFLVKTNHPVENFSKWALCIFVLFSFGEWGVLRTISYYVLPLMDTFRHPANARIFTIFFGCLLAGMMLQNIIKQKAILCYRNWRRLFFLLLISFAGVLTWALLRTDLSTVKFDLPSLSLTSIKPWFDELSFLELTIFNILLQIPFLWLCWKWVKKNLNTSTLIFFGVFNCIIHTALFQPFTVVQKETVSSFQSKLKSINRSHYPFPDLKVPINDNNMMDETKFMTLGPENMYNKRIGRSDFRITPSNLLTQDAFWSNKPLREKLLQNPFVYKADTAFQRHILPMNSWPLMVFLEDTELISKINGSIKSSADIRFERFTPNRFSLTIVSSTPGFYAVFQNYYPRWQVMIDGKVFKPSFCNESFIGFWLEKGTHEVKLQYKANDLIICMLISVVAFLSILIFICYTAFKSSSLSLR